MGETFTLSQDISDALFSPCRTWRYALWRVWDANMPAMMVIGLNPSTADETVNDPTVRRCINFARDWGYGSLYMMNLFAFRATLPKDMKATADPIGPDNDAALRTYAMMCPLILAAWGHHGKYLDRGDMVRTKVLPRRELHCLGKTKDGFPKHPLYIAKTTKPQVYTL